MLLSASDAASAMPLQTDSIGLALPVAFGCHGSRKNEAKWKHLASRCRNLTVQFSFLVWEPALVAVTGRGRGGDSVFSSFKHLGVGLTCDDWKGTGPVLLSLPHSCRVSGSVLGEHAVLCWLCCVWRGSCCLQTLILFLPGTSLLVLFFYLPLVWNVPRS